MESIGFVESYQLMFSEWHLKFKEKGLTALIGCGSSPGIRMTCKLPFSFILHGNAPFMPKFYDIICFLELGSQKVFTYQYLSFCRSQ
jgi:hypothetical protein